MFIYPSDVSGNVSIAVPRGELISISSQGNEQSFVWGSRATPTSPLEFDQLATLFNAAQTFGPWDYPRTIQILNRQATVEYAVGASPRLNSVPPLVLENFTPVSLVEPADTFIDLTYEDDGGAVKLVSEGEHGLTEAIAVGASVYVTWATGTGVDGLYEVTALDTDTTGLEITINYPYALGLGTPTVAVAGDEVTLATVALPASSVGVGGALLVEAELSFTENADAKVFSMELGGEQFLSINAVNQESVVVQRTLRNLGAGEVLTGPLSIVGPGFSGNPLLTLDLDLTEALDFVVTADPAVANNVVTLRSLRLTAEF